MRWMQKWNRWRGLIAPATGDVAQADAFVLLGFGLNVDENGRELPGASNVSLARWLVQHNPHRLPTITQQGTFLALKQLEQQQPTLNVDRWAINLPHDPQVHVDTYGAALQIWLICENAGLERVVLVTHPWQSERARRIFAKLPLTELIVPSLPPVPFDAQSAQRWTRNRWLYLLYEFGMARPIGHLFGWL